MRLFVLAALIALAFAKPSVPSGSEFNSEYNNEYFPSSFSSEWMTKFENPSEIESISTGGKYPTGSIYNTELPMIFNVEMISETIVPSLKPLTPKPLPPSSSVKVTGRVVIEADKVEGTSTGLWLSLVEPSIKVRSVSLNKEESESWMELPTPIGESSSFYTEMLSKPIKFNFDSMWKLSSVVSHLKSDPEWSINMKKALVQLIPTSLKTILRENSETEVGVKVHEESTIYGRCPTRYLVSTPEKSGNKNTWLVTKVRDLSVCDNRMSSVSDIFKPSTRCLSEMIRKNFFLNKERSSSNDKVNSPIYETECSSKSENVHESMSVTDYEYVISPRELDSGKPIDFSVNSIVSKSTILIPSDIHRTLYSFIPSVFSSFSSHDHFVRVESNIRLERVWSPSTSMPSTLLPKVSNIPSFKWTDSSLKTKSIVEKKINEELKELLAHPISVSESLCTPLVSLRTETIEKIVKRLDPVSASILKSFMKSIVGLSVEECKPKLNFFSRSVTGRRLIPLMTEFVLKSESTELKTVFDITKELCSVEGPEVSDMSVISKWHSLERLVSGIPHKTSVVEIVMMNCGKSPVHFPRIMPVISSLFRGLLTEKDVHHLRILLNSVEKMSGFESGMSKLFNVIQISSMPISTKTLLEFSTLYDSCSEELKRPISLAYSSMVGRVCDEVSSSVKSYEWTLLKERVCKPELLVKPIRVWVNEYLLKKSDPIHSARLLHNSALVYNIDMIESIISSLLRKPSTEKVAVNFIHSLYPLTMIRPKTVRRITMPIFLNKRLCSEVRLTAFHILMKTTSLDEIDRPFFEVVATTLRLEKDHVFASGVAVHLKNTLVHMRHHSSRSNPSCHKRIYNLINQFVNLESLISKVNVLPVSGTTERLSSSDIISVISDPSVFSIEHYMNGKKMSYGMIKFFDFNSEYPVEMPILNGHLIFSSVHGPVSKMTFMTELGLPITVEMNLLPSGFLFSSLFELPMKVNHGVMQTIESSIPLVNLAEMIKSNLQMPLSLKLNIFSGPITESLIVPVSKLVYGENTVSSTILVCKNEFKPFNVDKILLPLPGFGLSLKSHRNGFLLSFVSESGSPMKGFELATGFSTEENDNFVRILFRSTPVVEITKMPFSMVIYSSGSRRLLSIRLPEKSSNVFELLKNEVSDLRTSTNPLVKSCYVESRTSNGYSNNMMYMCIFSKLMKKDGLLVKSDLFSTPLDIHVSLDSEFKLKLRHIYSMPSELLELPTWVWKYLNVLMKIGPISKLGSSFMFRPETSIRKSFVTIFKNEKVLETISGKTIRLDSVSSRNTELECVSKIFLGEHTITGERFYLLTTLGRSLVPTVSRIVKEGKLSSELSYPIVEKMPLFEFITIPRVTLVETPSLVRVDVTSLVGGVNSEKLGKEIPSLSELIVPTEKCFPSKKIFSESEQFRTIPIYA